LHFFFHFKNFIFAQIGIKFLPNVDETNNFQFLDLLVWIVIIAIGVYSRHNIVIGHFARVFIPGDPSALSPA
jgi:hypothetical protein